MGLSNPFRSRRLRWKFRWATPRTPPTISPLPKASVSVPRAPKVPLSGRDDYVSSGDSGSDLLTTVLSSD